jgi:hypothetical protein
MLCDEPQLCYVLLTITPPDDTPAGWAVNWALVADASHSMRIPIIDEEKFRELVREHGAQEVLVDGVPVWQFDQPVPAEIRDTFPSAIDYVARALHSIVEQFEDDDRLSLVVCAEEARILVPATRGVNRAELARRIAMLKELNLGDQTDLEHGIRAGMAELAAARGDTPHQTERLVLLTDGFTQDPAACLNLARKAAAEGIAISTIGLGGEFQDDVLTGMADVSGGHAVFLRNAVDIPQAVAQELYSARAVVARSATLRFKMSQGVVLRRATRIRPTLAMLDIHPVTDQVSTLLLGDIERATTQSILFELVVPPTMPMVRHRPLHSEEFRVRLAQVLLATRTPSPTATPPAWHDIVMKCTSQPVLLPPPVVVAAAQANAVSLQHQAREAAQQGDHHRASRLLHSVAGRLRELGETALADIAQHEAWSLEHTGLTSRLGTKELMYATRRIGEQ